MNLSPAGAAFLRGLEGFVDHWYPDAVGVGTIGIGFTWASAGFREWWDRNRPGEKFGPGSRMTREQADKALIFICAMEYGAAVHRFLNRAVPQHVFDGAVSPVFNLGPGSLQWKWAAALKARDYAEAAELLRTTGTTAKGKKLKGLVTRRNEEAELIKNGDYTLGNAASDPLADGMLVRGERGKPVADLQTRLKSRGLYAGAVDGIFGYGTEAAVLEFQRAAGLVADGYAGPRTLAALQAASPQPHPIEEHEGPIAPAPERRGTNWLVVAGVLVAAAMAFIAFVPLPI